MKKMVGALIEEEIIRQAKLRSAQEGRTLDDLIQEALVSHLSGKKPGRKRRETAYKIFCEQPMGLSREQFKEILKTDAYE